MMMNDEHCYKYYTEFPQDLCKAVMFDEKLKDPHPSLHYLTIHKMIIVKFNVKKYFYGRLKKNTVPTSRLTFFSIKELFIIKNLYLTTCMSHFILKI